MNWRSLKTPQFSPWAEARETLDSSHYIVPEDDLTILERVWLEALNDMQRGFRDKTKRKLVVGESESANAWTDGATYIAFNREWLGSRPLINKGRAVFSSVMAAALLLGHELCHDDNSLTQGHTPDFYREYHDMHDTVTWAADSVFRSFNEPNTQDKSKARAKKEKEAATRRKARARKAKEKTQREAEKAAKKTTTKTKKVAARTIA
jgi:hypothetical protein